MPHVPGKFANTAGLPPESLAKPAGPHSPIPQSRPAREETRKPRRLRVGLGKISLYSHEPDLQKVCEALLGKEVKIDEHTGQLVPSKGGPVPAQHGS